MTVSKVDILHLKKIRDTIDELHLQFAKKLDVDHIKVLDVAPEVYEGVGKHFKSAHVDTLDIDPNSNATIIADLGNCPSVQDNYYDLIFCTEVLEHTIAPQLCVNSLHRILKPGGTVVVTTPFNFRIHNPLPDFWRFTEHGLKLLFNNSGFLDVKICATESDRFLMPIQYTVLAQK